MTSPEPAADSAIELEGVAKVYRLYSNRTDQVLDGLGALKLAFWRKPSPPREFPALEGIDLRVGRGERVGVIGRNGAGKTTLLKLITGNFAPTRGRVTVKGSVQALMQTGLGIHPEFTGYENIRSALQYNGLPADRFDAAVADIIEFCELGEFLHQPVQTYSTGMRARLQFATATAVSPDILIVDEVLGAGDAYFIGKSTHRMDALIKSGCTLLLVSHSMQQVLQFCDRAIWIDRGRIVMQDKALDVVRAYEESIQRLEHQRRLALARGGADGAASAEADNAAAARDTARDFETPRWQQERMLTLLDSRTEATHAGSEVSRWPGERGLKITGVRIVGGDGLPTNAVPSGAPVRIEVDLTAEYGGRFECRISVLIMTLEGIGVSRNLSAPFLMTMQEGECRTVELCFDQTLFAAGEFIFSAAAFRYFDPEDMTSARRYDLLSRSFRLKVTPRLKFEPGLFHHPARWILPVDGATSVHAVRADAS